MCKWVTPKLCLFVLFGQAEAHQQGHEYDGEQGEKVRRLRRWYEVIFFLKVIARMKQRGWSGRESRKMDLWVELHFYMSGRDRISSSEHSNT